MVKSSREETQAVEDFFSSEADDYSSFFLDRQSGANYSFRRRLALVSEVSADGKGNLLDCACGSGEITTALANTGRFDGITAVDLSCKMLSLAEAKLGPVGERVDVVNVNYVNSNIFDFFSKPGVGSYQLILCLGLIAHTGRLSELLQAMKSLLGKNGSIILQSTLAEHSFTKIVRLMTEKRYARTHGYHVSYYTENDIEMACEEVGLTIRAVRKFSLGIPFADRIWARGNYYLEKHLGTWAASHGTEAIFKIEVSQE
jgi:2-polyprenyl-3-methyl-5-hydroxy-6-metoxy-1,4-benzoquinol methylase